MLKSALKSLIASMQRHVGPVAEMQCINKWHGMRTSRRNWFVSCRASRASSGTPSAHPRLTWPHRTHLAGTLREEHVDQNVSLCGWVDRVRHLGAITFVDVRDHSGLCQVVVGADAAADLKAVAGRLRPETVICVRGRIRRRSDPNPVLPSGQIEADPSTIELINALEGTLPIPVSAAAAEAGDNLKDEVRLRHRVLDLR